MAGGLRGKGAAVDCFEFMEEVEQKTKPQKCSHKKVVSQPSSNKKSVTSSPKKSVTKKLSLKINPSAFKGPAVAAFIQTPTNHNAKPIKTAKTAPKPKKISQTQQADKSQQKKAQSAKRNQNRPKTVSTVEVTQKAEEVKSLYQSMTIIQLREGLKERGLQVFGVKPDLIARLEKADEKPTLPTFEQLNKPATTQTAKKMTKTKQPTKQLPQHTPKQLAQPMEMSYCESSPGGSIDSNTDTKPTKTKKRTAKPKSDDQRNDTKKRKLPSKVSTSSGKAQQVGGYVQFISPPRHFPHLSKEAEPNGSALLPDMSPITFSRRDSYHMQVPGSPFGNPGQLSPDEDDHDRKKESAKKVRRSPLENMHSFDNVDDQDEQAAGDLMSPRKLVEDLAYGKKKRKPVKKQLVGKAKIEKEERLDAMLNLARAEEEKIKNFYNDIDNESLEDCFEIV